MKLDWTAIALALFAGTLLIVDHHRETIRKVQHPVQDTLVIPIDTNFNDWFDYDSTANDSVKSTAGEKRKGQE